MPTKTAIPYWYRENLEFKQRNRSLLLKGQELLDQSTALLEEAIAFAKTAGAETETLTPKELSKLPGSKPYIEKIEEVFMLELRSHRLLGRWAECERVRLDCLRCAMQFHGVDRIPNSWLKEISDNAS